MFPGKGRHGWAPALPRLGKTRSEEADEKLERREGRSPGVLSKPVVREHVQPTGISGISRWGNAVFSWASWAGCVLQQAPGLPDCIVLQGPGVNGAAPKAGSLGSHLHPLCSCNPGTQAI